MPYGEYAIMRGDEDTAKPRTAAPDWKPTRQYKAPPLPRCFHPITGRVHPWPNGHKAPEPVRLSPGQACMVHWTWSAADLHPETGLDPAHTDVGLAAFLEGERGWYPARFVAASGAPGRGLFVLYDDTGVAWPFYADLKPQWVKPRPDAGQEPGAVPMWACARLF